MKTRLVPDYGSINDSAPIPLRDAESWGDCFRGRSPLKQLSALSGKSSKADRQELLSPELGTRKKSSLMLKMQFSGAIFGVSSAALGLYLTLMLTMRDICTHFGEEFFFALAVASLFLVTATEFGLRVVDCVDREAYDYRATTIITTPLAYASMVIFMIRTMALYDLVYLHSESRRQLCEWKGDSLVESFGWAAFVLVPSILLTAFSLIKIIVNLLHGLGHPDPKIEELKRADLADYI